MLGLLDRATKLTSPQGESGGLVRDRKPGEGLALVTFVVAECPLCARSGHSKPLIPRYSRRQRPPYRKRSQPLETSAQCARRSRRESKLKFTSQVRQNRLRSMDARDQRDRQQFHEAKIFDAVQAPVLTGSIDAALLHALIENIEIGASREVPKAAALDDLRGYRRLVTSIHTKPALHVVITASDFFILPWEVRSQWLGVGVVRTKHLYRAARSM